MILRYIIAFEVKGRTSIKMYCKFIINEIFDRIGFAKNYLTDNRLYTKYPVFMEFRPC